MSKVIKAPYTGILNLGGIELVAAVTEDGRRLLSERAVAAALGSKRGGSHWKRKKEAGIGAFLPVYLSANNLRPFINDELATKLANRPQFQGSTGGVAFALEAELLPDVCTVFLDAREKGALTSKQLPLADIAQTIHRALAKVGIIALVDEATGYQYDRARHALEEILEQFISKELLVWAKRFPDEFYIQLFRLKKWQPSKIAHRRPAIVGKITNDLVYARLAPGVKDELHRITPRDKKGKLKEHLHRRLTEDVGNPALRAHLHAVIALMRISSTYRQFLDRMNEVFPVWGKTMSLPLTTEDSGEPVPLKFPKGTKPKDALKAAMQVDPDKVKMRKGRRK